MDSPVGINHGIAFERKRFCSSIRIPCGYDIPSNTPTFCISKRQTIHVPWLMVEM